MPDEHAAADLSVAYVQAVAAAARVEANFATAHDYGIDGNFRQIVARGGRRVATGFPLDFQLKASKNWSETTGIVKYNLEAKNYNDMAERNAQPGAVPLVLILLCLPQSVEEWVQISPEQMILKRCCFWYRLTGALTDNKEKKVVAIPTSQLLDPQAVTTLLERTQKGELL